MNRFKDGRETTEDDARIGRPVTATDEKTVAAIHQFIQEDRRTTVENVADKFAISYGAAQDVNVSATIRGKFLSHLFLEVFCQSCTLGFVPLFSKFVGHTVSENIYLFIILCHRIPLYPKHYFIF